MAPAEGSLGPEGCSCEKEAARESMAPTGSSLLAGSTPPFSLIVS